MMDQDFKDIYLQLLGFHSVWQWGRFELRWLNGLRQLVPVKRQKHHGLRSWDVDSNAGRQSYEFWKIYSKYGIFR